MVGSVSASAIGATENNNYIRHADASLTLTLYDCAAGKFIPPVKNLCGDGGQWQAAVDSATDSAVRRYMLKVATVATSS